MEMRKLYGQIAVRSEASCFRYSQFPPFYAFRVHIVHMSGIGYLLVSGRRRNCGADGRACRVGEWQGQAGY